MDHDPFALQLGPTLDDLVKIAHDAGWDRAKPRTIRSWVEKDYVARPRQQARRWRYPNVSAGQVDSCARMLARNIHSDFHRFGLFVETGSGSAQQARAFLVEYLRYWREGVSSNQKRLADPDALREEAAKVARQKGKNAPLPHRVRVRLDERTEAMQVVLAQLLQVPISKDEQAAGQFQLERLLGLRAGRGGAERDLSVLGARTDTWVPDAETLIEAVTAASAERIELTRRTVEMGVVWLPALRSVWAAPGAGTVTSAALVDVVEEWEEKTTVDQCALMFAIGLANAMKTATDDQVRQHLAAFRPEMFAAMLLSAASAADRELAVKRLRIYPRMRLGAFLDEVRSRAR